MQPPRIEQRLAGWVALYASVAFGCERPSPQEVEATRVAPVRVATFNVSLHRRALGELAADLAGGADEQARMLADIIQRVRPDVLVLNEFDYDADRPDASWRHFHDEYLAVGRESQEGIRYSHFFVAPVNTGVPSGFD